MKSVSVKDREYEEANYYLSLTDNALWNEFERFLFWGSKLDVLNDLSNLLLSMILNRSRPVLKEASIKNERVQNYLIYVQSKVKKDDKFCKSFLNSNLSDVDLALSVSAYIEEGRHALGTYRIPSIILAVAMIRIGIDKFCSS